MNTSSSALTNREKEVLELLSQGLLNKEIAYRLYITENTVEYYLKQVYKKIKVANRVQASKYYQNKL